MTLTTQWTTVFLMMGSGFFIGIILDTYRVLKARFGLTGWVVSLIDLLYWVVSAGLVFSLLFWSNWGDFRFYIFIVILMGLGAYLRWCSKEVRVSISWIVQGVDKVIHYTYRIIYQLLWVPLVHLWRFLTKVHLFVITVVKTLVSFFLQPFRWALQPVQRVLTARIRRHFSWVSNWKKWWTKKNTEDDEDV